MADILATAENVWNMLSSGGRVGTRDGTPAGSAQKDRITNTIYPIR